MLLSLSACLETAIVKYIDTVITALLCVTLTVGSMEVLFTCIGFCLDVSLYWTLFFTFDFQLWAASALLHYCCRAWKYEKSGGLVAFSCLLFVHTASQKQHRSCQSTLGAKITASLSWL